MKCKECKQQMDVISTGRSASFPRNVNYSLSFGLVTIFICYDCKLQFRNELAGVDGDYTRYVWEPMEIEQ